MPALPCRAWKGSRLPLLLDAGPIGLVRSWRETPSSRDHATRSGRLRHCNGVLITGSLPDRPPIGRPVEVYGRGDQAARVLPTTRQIVASPHSYSRGSRLQRPTKSGSSLVFTGTANRPRSRPGDTSLRSRRNNARRDPRHQPSTGRRSCSPDSAAVHLLCGVTR